MCEVLFGDTFNMRNSDGNFGLACTGDVDALGDFAVFSFSDINDFTCNKATFTIISPEGKTGRVGNNECILGYNNNYFIYNPLLRVVMEFDDREAAMRFRLSGSYNYNENLNIGPSGESEYFDLDNI